MICQKPRQLINFDKDWLFFRGDIEWRQAKDDSQLQWQPVTIPHDFSIEGEYRKEHSSGIKGGFLPTGIGWYKKSFYVSQEEVNKQVFIDFEGIYMNSDVWINDHHLGYRPNGYIGFEYCLSPYLHAGKNTIVVRVDNSKAPSARWYTGSGIYRHTWLVIKENLFIPHWGTCVTTKWHKENSMAEVFIENQVINKCSRQQSVKVRVHMGDVDAVSNAFDIGPGEKAVICQKLQIHNPQLWSPTSPNLYVLHIQVYVNTELFDEIEMQIGVRSFSYNSTYGFVLNGKPTKLKGVCEHQDAGPVGVAVPNQVLYRRLRLLKEMGCNAIRTAHAPMSPVFYQYCDKLGFIVMNEMFDGWETPKVPYDYGLYFTKWWKKDLEDFIRRDRNHPCVIFWSIGNEVIDMTKETTQCLLDYVHKLDPTRPVTCGIQQKNINADLNRSFLDIAGYNGGGGAAFAFEQDHQVNPHRVCVATEIPHTFQTRGFYRTQTWWRDKGQERIEVENLTDKELFFDGSLAYNSSYDNAGVRISARDSWRQTKRLPYLIGEFRWSGFDYLGESFGWPARSANFGVLDLCGFKKDLYYFYQSQWSKEPMIHILPHWNHEELDFVEIPVWVYTNCYKAELFLNGTSMGIKYMGEGLRLEWSVPYQSGNLKVIGWHMNGVIVEKEVHTSLEPCSLVLDVDQGLGVGSQNVSHITIEAIDKEEHIVPYANNKVYVRLLSGGRHLGMENGDPLDLTPAKSFYRTLFYGKCLHMVQGDEESSQIRAVYASILGQTYFQQESKVYIYCEDVILRGNACINDYSIYYTLNNSEPHKLSSQYTGGFTINETCIVKAKVYLKDEELLTLEEGFIKGSPPKVIDTQHSNKQYFDGPKAKEVIGRWQRQGHILEFDKRGLVSEYIDEKLIKDGEWWYDYPSDPYEQPDFMGIGEIQWSKEENQSIELKEYGGIHKLKYCNKTYIKQ